MPTLKLTDALVRSAKPPGFEAWDTLVPGLKLVWGVKRKSFFVVVRVKPDGKQVKGRIGTISSLTLAEARDLARWHISQAERGVDTLSKGARRDAARKVQVEAQRAQANSLRNTVEAYFQDPTDGGGKDIRSRRMVEARLEKHVLPILGDRPVAEITRRDIRDLLRSLVEADMPSLANHVHSNLTTIFGWALNNYRLPDDRGSPMAGLKKPAKDSGRNRVLDESELVEVWKACAVLAKAQAAPIRLMILTGARRNEAFRLERSEIKDDGWHLPAERSKNGLPHWWYLSDLARSVIDDVPEVEGNGRFVFSLDGRTAVSSYSKIKIKLDTAIGEARAEAAGEPYDAERHNMLDWRFHDLRRTAITKMNDYLHVHDYIVEAVVGHISGSKGGIAGNYNKAKYQSQRIVALEKWSQYVAALLEGRPTEGITYQDPANNVVELRRVS